MRFRMIVCGLFLSLHACAPQREVAVTPSAVEAPNLVRLDKPQCQQLLRDDSTPESLQQAIGRSVTYLEKLPPERTFVALNRRLRASALLDFLRALPPATSSAEWMAAVCERTALYRVELDDGFLITGYYQPELRASRTRRGSFQYPLYRPPDDLIDVDVSQWCPDCSHRVTQGRVKEGRLIPYYSRREIDAGALAGRGYEIAWLQDPVDVFFMHVQGSAVLRFDDGVQMHVSYSNSNGHPYTSIGKVLIEREKLTRHELSMQTLRSYLRAHPDEQAEIMGNNARYIFFRTVPNGPIGSLGVALTAGRSLAADAAVYPPGALVFLNIEPRPEASGQAPTNRFALIQDAGIAITGPRRLDVYWGTGEPAEDIAGDMRNPGQLYLVLPPE